ncbi:MAG: ArsR family transcriptional regulator [Pseudomonadota bacterium]
MSLAEIRMAHIRGALIGLLCEGTKANDSVLHDAVTALRAVTCSRDQVRAALRWLEEQGLISIEKVGDYLVAQISQRGIDFEEGRIVLDGIKRRAR